MRLLLEIPQKLLDIENRIEIMIPKIIHCVWLSGSEKPAIYRMCVESWRKYMPDYKIMEWSLLNLPDDILSHPYVKGAIRYKKWAYATDVIRLWALKTYGGIYLDMDVVVYKSFDAFLGNRFFSSVECNPSVLYSSIDKHNKEIIGIGIEAAVMGSEPGHPYIADVMKYYEGFEFRNNPKFHHQYIMPRVMTRVAVRDYGFRQIPNYQILREDIHLYPCDVFSSVYDPEIVACPSKERLIDFLAENPIRYSFHVVMHSWWDGLENTESNMWKIKHFVFKLFGGRISRKSVQNLFRKPTWHA